MNAVVKTNKNEVMTPIGTRLGFEEPIDKDDLIIPRAKLFQGTPTEQSEYPDARGGQILNSLTKEVVSGLFIPCFKWTEVVKFNGRNQKDEDFDPAFPAGAMIWKCQDPTNPKWKEGDWGTNGEKPTAMRTINFLCWFEGQTMPLILSFAKTSYRSGKKLLSLAQFSGGNMFDRKYIVGTKKEESDGNIYHVFTIDTAGIATEKEKETPHKWYSELRGKQLKVHEEETVSNVWTE